MTLRTNARLAGYTYLVYLAAGIGSLALAGRTQLTGVLDVFASFSALVLGVTLYALTAILLLQRSGLFSGATSWASSATWLVWLPMLVFELWFAWWLIVRGIATPAREATRIQHLTT